MQKLLSLLSDDEVLGFGHMFYEKLCELNQWRLWAAGYVIAGGMSDAVFTISVPGLLAKVGTRLKWQ